MNNQERSVDPAAQQVLRESRSLSVLTAWDRHERMQPLCGFGDLGLCCDVCYQGPCRIDPFGEGPQVGICGADAHLIVARNLARSVAVGAASHSDHGREVVEVFRHAADAGFTSGYALANEDKLRALAIEWNVESVGRSSSNVASDLARAMSAQFGAQEGPLVPLMRAPKGQRERWTKLGIMPRGIDREIVELMHRTHHGVESDAIALLRAAMRTALSDGWGGSMIATDVQDVLFGGPQAIRSRANLGVLEEKQVNILCHGHEPVLSEMIVAASRDPELKQKARAAGADGINVAGICCTANEILMRQGMPVAGNYLHQELALLTGAVDVMVVDVQCVMPSLPQVAACHHTKIVTTSPKADIPGSRAHRVRADTSPGDCVAPSWSARLTAIRSATRRGSRSPRNGRIWSLASPTRTCPYTWEADFVPATGLSSMQLRPVACAVWSVLSAATPFATFRTSTTWRWCGPCSRATCCACRPAAAPSRRPRPDCSGPRRRSSTRDRVYAKSAKPSGYRPCCTSGAASTTRAFYPCAWRSAPRAASARISPSCQSPQPRPSR